mgnify:CR=1 FL=1
MRSLTRCSTLSRSTRAGVGVGAAAGAAIAGAISTIFTLIATEGFQRTPARGTLVALSLLGARVAGTGAAIGAIRPTCGGG